MVENFFNPTLGNTITFYQLNLEEKFCEIEIKIHLNQPRVVNHHLGRGAAGVIGGGSD